MKLDKENLKLAISKYRHRLASRVKFEDVDMFGVVHNIKYLYWLEWARTEYFSAIGVKLNPFTFINDYPLMVVHSNLDYYASLRFNDEYLLLTKVDEIKNSSIHFSNLIIDKFENIIVSASAVLVHLDQNSMDSKKIGEELRIMVQNYESGQAIH